MVSERLTRAHVHPKEEVGVVGLSLVTVSVTAVGLVRDHVQPMGPRNGAVSLSFPTTPMRARGLAVSRVVIVAVVVAVVVVGAVEVAVGSVATTALKTK